MALSRIIASPDGMAPAACPTDDRRGEGQPEFITGFNTHGYYPHTNFERVTCGEPFGFGGGVLPTATGGAIIASNCATMSIQVKHALHQQANGSAATLFTRGSPSASLRSRFALIHSRIGRPFLCLVMSFSAVSIWK